jgi:hypothetical protein
VTTTYTEPTTLWRLYRDGGTKARAMLVPHGRTCTLLWWIDECLASARECSDWALALTLAETLRRELRRQGFVDDDDDH